MEIKKYKKLKNNVYELELSDNLKIKLYDDVIVKYNLLLKKNITDKELKEIINFNDELESYYLAIKYISKKLRSEKEVIEYLKKNNYNSVVIDKTINRLKKYNYLNREVYIKSFINDRYNFSYDGPNKIKRKLNELGFNDDEIIPCIDKDYQVKIEKIIDKKVSSNHKLSNNMLKQNISNYLINLGYSKDMFIDYLNKININNKEYLIKDLDKLFNKFKNKYNEKELRYVLKNKLFIKGYSTEEIEEVLDEKLL